MVCYTWGLTTLETRYCSFSPLCCFSYMHFILICTVVVLYCSVLCVCVYVCVCLWGFCNVWVFLVICILYCDWGFLNLTEVFLTVTEVFPCFFLSCKANARVKLAKAGHGLHSFTLVCICVNQYLFVLKYVLFVCKCVLPPGDNPTAVNKYHIIYLPVSCKSLGHARACVRISNRNMSAHRWASCIKT
jgi:hypothetical protein